jgi:hypothetical protein
MNEVAQAIETVIVKPVKARDILPGARRSLTVLLDQYGKLRHGSSDEDVKAYEKATGQVCDLKFWQEFHIILDEDETRLDRNDPADRLKINLLRLHYRVANGPDDVSPLTDYVMYDETAEAERDVKSFRSEIKAASLLEQLNPVQVCDFLALYGKNAMHMNPSVAYKTLVTEMRADPEKFIRMFEDEDKKLKILIQQLLFAKVLQRKGQAVYFGDPNREDTLLLGANMETTLEFLRNAKNQDLRIALEKERDKHK